MRIDDYLKEIEPAVTTLINAIFCEQQEVEALGRDLSRFERETADGYARVDSINRFEEELAQMPGYQDDDPMLATAIYWETYFGSDKERYYTDQKLQNAMLQISAHEFARNSLAGALLQIAKQGISLWYGRNVADCLELGRIIGEQPIRDVIWQARNQAIHWEDGQFHGAVDNVFKKLVSNFGPPFDKYTQQSLAFEIVNLLNWSSFEHLDTDLRALEPS
jgi:hypothetical protein